MDEQAKRKRQSYSAEFKRDAVRLVVEEGYSFKAACKAVGVCDATLRVWHAKLAPPPEPCGENATLEELQTDLDLWMSHYKQQRPHSGRYCYGKTSMEIFKDSKSIVDEKRLDKNLQTVAIAHPKKSDTLTHYCPVISRIVATV